MLRRAGEGDCGGCTPLQVTGARLGAMTVATSRGAARAPAWEYTLAGSRVRIAVVAVDPGSIVKVTPPPWDPDDPPGGLRIDGAVLALDGRTLTAHFTGAEEGDGPCGAAYTARAIESEHAVVVIVDAHPNRRAGELQGGRLHKISALYRMRQDETGQQRHRRQGSSCDTPGAGLHNFYYGGSPGEERAPAGRVTGGGTRRAGRRSPWAITCWPSARPTPRPAWSGWTMKPALAMCAPGPP